jgi:hypothetical protein
MYSNFFLFANVASIILQQQMKPLIVILLLFVFAYLQMGFYLHTLKLRAEARSEFKEKIKTSLISPDVDVFEWNAIKHNIRWEEEGEEFWLKGQLYDVLTQKTIDGKKYLYCLNDAKEEQVVEQQLKVISNSNSSDKNLKTLKFSLPDFLLFRSDEKQVATINNAKVFFKNVKELLQYSSPTSPPPEA